jgi:hypothetical protein
MKWPLLALALLMCGCPRTEGDLLIVPDAGHCASASCNGCCDTDGVCQPGLLPSSCGENGVACVACAPGVQCVDGTCGIRDGGPCSNCRTSTECGLSGVCVQIAADDVCADPCGSDGGCDPNAVCVQTTAFDGADILTCVPNTGSCGALSGCGSCAAGTTCNFVTGHCDALTSDAGFESVDGGRCGPLVSASVSACCHACTVGVGDCQPNGCYGGWWCDTAISPCWCRKPPEACGIDAGVIDAGPITGTVGPDGGTVSRLYFAVVGDTRPANLDDTAGYPTTVVNTIFADIQALSPRPQFVIATGDYMFATATGNHGAPQLAKFVAAAHQFSGPVFAAMGNQECNGYTSDNCAGVTNNNNYDAYLSSLVTPLGLSRPYYAFRVDAADHSWAAKFIVLACNAWDATQRSWLQTEMSSPTTYTFVVRHEPSASTTAPCVPGSDAVLQQYPYTMLLVGHSHTYSASPGTRVLLVGNGGAPSSTTYGFAVVEQAPQGFFATEYDWSTGVPVSSALFAP